MRVRSRTEYLAAAHRNRCVPIVVPSRNNEKTTGNSSALLASTSSSSHNLTNTSRKNKQFHTEQPFLFFLTFFSGKSNLLLLLLTYTFISLIFEDLEGGIKSKNRLEIMVESFRFCSEFENVFMSFLFFLKLE